METRDVSRLQNKTVPSIALGLPDDFVFLIHQGSRIAADQEGMPDSALADLFAKGRIGLFVLCRQGKGKKKTEEDGYCIGFIFIWVGVRLKTYLSLSLASLTFPLKRGFEG